MSYAGLVWHSSCPLTGFKLRIDCSYYLLGEQNPTNTCCFIWMRLYTSSASYPPGQVFVPFIALTATLVGILAGTPFSCSCWLKPCLQARCHLQRFSDFKRDQPGNIVLLAEAWAAMLELKPSMKGNMYFTATTCKL